LTPLLQLAVSVGLLVALIAVVDWQALRNAAGALSAGTLVVASMVCLAAQSALVLRWRALIDMLGVRESWSRSWHSVFAGLFLTNFLPGTLGSDGLRVVLLTRSFGRASTAIGAVAYERLMQLALYMLATAVAAMAPMPGLAASLRIGIVLVGVIGVICLMLVLYWFGRRSMDPSVERAGLARTIWRLGNSILIETGRMQTKMRRHRRATWAFWGASFLNIAMILLLFKIVLADLEYPISMSGIVLSAGGSAIATAIPISLNGIGVYEASLVTLLGLSGVPLAVALLTALIVRCVALLVSLVGLPSVVLLWRLGRVQSPLKP
jgi:uncharacterized protein (TIRG00374 family)